MTNIKSLVVSVLLGLSAVQATYANYYADDQAIKSNMMNPNVFDESNADWKKAQQKAEEQRKAFNSVMIPEKNSFPNVQVGKFSNIDVQKIAERYSKRVEAEKRTMTGVIGFASFSMPDASLKKLIADTLKVNGTVLFIGFKNNDFKETAKEIRRLDIRKGNIQINPNAFKQYKVDVVPSIVMVKANAEENLDGEGCVFPEKYSKVVGDVSLDFALELMEKNEKGELKQLANNYLNQLRGKVGE
jgi:conjugal transfer pilus assembly protein TrbC